jgi:hypothetical protein
MRRALPHTRIIWVLSPTSPQIWSVTAGSPCAHGVVGTPHGEVRDRQHDDQFNCGIPRIKIHINHWQPSKREVPNAFVRAFGDQAMILEVPRIG